MRMKGMVCAIITMMLVTSLTFAAGQGEQEQEEGVVTLNVLNYADMASQEGRTWEAIRDAFMAAHPDIQLEVETLYDEPYHQKLAASVAAGSVPDVMYLWPGGRSRQVTQTGLVADLTPHIEDIRDNYVPSALAPQGDGNLYELPIAVTATHVLYVNTPVLREAGLEMPETYEELREVAAELRDAGKDAVIMANADAWVMNSTLLGTLVGRLGGPTWMEEAVNGEHSFTDPVFVDALELIQDMYQSGVLPNGSIQTGYGEVPSNFAEDRGAFLVDGDWRVGALVPLLSAEEQQEI